MSTTIEFSEMKAFVAVVNDGSFTAAAERLNTDKARVSRIISRVEEKLGVQLLTRSTRSLNVTEIGKNYYERAVAILSAAEAAEVAVAQKNGVPRGLLKITAGSEFGTAIVDSWISKFLVLHPLINVETLYTNRQVDLIHEGIDVAVRIGHLPDSELSARKLGEINYGLYASKTYCQTNGCPKTVDSLSVHKLIMKSSRGKACWELESGGETVLFEGQPRACVNSILSALNLSLAGIGIAQLPDFIARRHVEDGNLLLLLPEWKPLSQPVHLLFASSKFMDPKVRSFIDFCTSESSDSL
ncbi:LysR family transcriptional regulator [Alteromonas macleodii]|nr:LysR family transcriptional regulator [Alteromonas macleodii]|tara:strand:+ start:7909 stop:8805 length:897 start_codon:yes stop_codon:yes gene_type:complete